MLHLCLGLGMSCECGLGADIDTQLHFLNESNVS